MSKKEFRTNCFVYAIVKFINEGGYLVVRRSHLTKFWHFLWMKNGEIKHYVPKDPRKRVMPPVLFEGIVKEGDE
jgi:hypothetical protein